MSEIQPYTRPILTTTRDSTLTQQPLSSVPSTPQTPPTSLQDASRIQSDQGNALPTLSLLSDTDIPNWTNQTKKGILSSFQRGLREYGTTPAELTQLLHELGISSMEINEQNIQDPAYAAEIERIQTCLNSFLDFPEARKLGISHSIGVDGQFGKNSIGALLALSDMDRGPAVTIPVTPIEQRSRTGCYITSEAMLFNAVHQKDGTPDAYGEFDTRDRISDQDRNKDTVYAGVRSEDSRGRISVSREQALAMVDAIDQNLDRESPEPVIAGVSYRKQNGHEYNEGITDHYVLITGRGSDANGTYYTFNDPANGGQGKFRLDPMTGKLSGAGDMAGIYDVTSATIYETDAATTERYQKLGKVLMYSGDHGADVQKVQTMLTFLGHDTNGTEGRYGSGTTTAVQAFQSRFEDLPNMGQVDTHTLAKLEQEFRTFQTANPNQVMFVNGSSHAMVADVQKLLTEMGFNTKGARGQFGPATEQAIRNFQQQYQIPVEPGNLGKLDNQTWLRILAEAESQGLH